MPRSVFDFRAVVPLSEANVVTRDTIETFLAHSRVALAGASRSERGFGNAVRHELIGKGYEVHLVHPEADFIAGQPCHATLGDLPEGVETLITIVKPESALSLIRQAPGAGVRRVWLQPGSESDEAIAFCQEHGIEVVHGQCVLMHSQPTGLHRLHRWTHAVTGRLPKCGPCPHEA